MDDPDLIVMVLALIASIVPPLGILWWRKKNEQPLPKSEVQAETPGVEHLDGAEIDQIHQRCANLERTAQWRLRTRGLSETYRLYREGQPNEPAAEATFRPFGADPRTYYRLRTDGREIDIVRSHLDGNLHQHEIVEGGKNIGSIVFRGIGVFYKDDGGKYRFNKGSIPSTCNIKLDGEDFFALKGEISTGLLTARTYVQLMDAERRPLALMSNLGSPFFGRARYAATAESGPQALRLLVCYAIQRGLGPIQQS